MSSYATRRLLVGAAMSVACLVGACQPEPERIVVVPRAAATSATASTSAAQPTAQTQANQTATTGVAPTSVPSVPAATAARPQYQMDPQHSGRTPFAGPRSPAL